MNYKVLFTGRMSRKSYFLSLIILISLFFIALFTIISILDFIANYFGLQSLYVDLALISIPFIFFYFYQLSIDTRRLHDMGYSGHFSLIHFVPYLGLFVTLFFLTKKGDKIQNKYGDSINDFQISTVFYGYQDVRNTKKFKKNLSIGILLCLATIVLLGNLSETFVQRSEWSNNPGKEQLDSWEEQLFGNAVIDMLLK